MNQLINDNVKLKLEVQFLRILNMVLIILLIITICYIQKYKNYCYEF